MTNGQLIRRLDLVRDELSGLRCYAAEYGVMGDVQEAINSLLEAIDRLEENLEAKADG